MNQPSRPSRRRFLSGLGGLLVALPFLEGLAPRQARADDKPPQDPFFLTFLQWFGVQQRQRFGGSNAGEAERFWPDVTIDPGQSIKLTQELLARKQGDQLRATGELAAHADSLLMLRGVRVMDLRAGLHRQNLVQVLSGSRSQKARPDKPNQDDPNNGWPMHETLDSLFTRKLGAPDPLVLETVMSKSTYSFRNGKDGGVPEDNIGQQQPSKLYSQLFTQSTLDAQAMAANKYATDAVKDEISRLKADPRLSAADRQRLEQHFEAMYKVETTLKGCKLPLPDDRMKHVLAADQPKGSNSDQAIWFPPPDFNYNQYTETVATAFIEIAALGAACGAFRAANLVMPTTTTFDHSSIFDSDKADYQSGFGGHYHAISHRAFSSMTGGDDADGSGGEAATLAHHRIDRWHGRMFALLLDRLREYDALDRGLTVWTNELANGNHWSYDLPYIVAGTASGRLRSGQYIDLQREHEADGERFSDGTDQAVAAIRAKQTPCCKVLNTLGAALGIKSDDGKPLHDFGGLDADNYSEMPRVTGNLPDLLNLG